MVKRVSPVKTPKTQEEEHLHSFCKQMLKARIFKGNYQERRYVESLGEYRDLIVLSQDKSKRDEDLRNDLKYIKHRISTFYNDINLWIGISLPEMIGTPVGTCIWTEISDIPFGEHWFCVKSIRFRQNEVIIKLITVPGSNVSSSDTNFEQKNNQENDEIIIDSLYELLLSWQESIRTRILKFFSQDFTAENIMAVIRFICILILALLTASLHAVQFLGAFTLRFMNEFRKLLHTSTPIILKLIDVLCKIVGGLFILLAMLWRDIIFSLRGTPPQPPPWSNRMSIMDSRPNMNYNSRNFVTANNKYGTRNNYGPRGRY